MNLQELLQRLAYFTDPANAIGAVLYFIIDHNGEQVIKMADVVQDMQIELRDRFLDFINDKFINNEDMSLMDISAADERKNVLFSYNLDERPEGLNLLNEVLGNGQQPLFSFENDGLENIKGYLITIGNAANKIVLYKKHHPVNLLRQDRFLMFRDDERLAKVPGDVIALDRSFDFMLLDDELFILNLATLERHFGFEAVIRSQAQQAINTITINNILENAEAIQDIAQNMTNARKLMRLRNSPVLNLPVANIIDFIKGHPDLSKKIRFNADESRISLDTGVSKKHFLKLLNDDYLFSQLTALYYDSLAKDTIVIVQAPQNE